MKTIGNIIWFVLIGWWTAIAWAAVGLLWCITIIGIPIGAQCFKFAGMGAFPFKKEVIFSDRATSVVLNILWLIFGGIELALSYLSAGIVLCVTLIGIPFGLQCFKLMKLAFLPFGAEITTKY